MQVKEKWSRYRHSRKRKNMANIGIENAYTHTTQVSWLVDHEYQQLPWNKHVGTPQVAISDGSASANTDGSLIHNDLIDPINASETPQCATGRDNLSYNRDGSQIVDLSPLHHTASFGIRPVCQLTASGLEPYTASTPVKSVCLDTSKRNTRSTSDQLTLSLLTVGWLWFCSTNSPF